MTGCLYSQAVYRHLPLAHLLGCTTGQYHGEWIPTLSTVAGVIVIVLLAKYLASFPSQYRLPFEGNMSSHARLQAVILSAWSEMERCYIYDGMRAFEQLSLATPFVKRQLSQTFSQ